jgi:hypothetical protein
MERIRSAPGVGAEGFDKGYPDKEKNHPLAAGYFQPGRKRKNGANIWGVKISCRPYINNIKE